MVVIYGILESIFTDSLKYTESYLKQSLALEKWNLLKIYLQ